MPAIVERDPVVVAISSGGRRPVLARRLREAIERLLPARLGRLACFAESFRERRPRTAAGWHGQRRALLGTASSTGPVAKRCWRARGPGARGAC